MKKSLFILFVCLAPCVFAQKSFFGVDAGVNVANQREHSTHSYSVPFSITTTLFFQNCVKPTLGFFYQRSFSNLIAVRVQARYMGMGYNDNYSGSPSNNLEINYLTFPVSLFYSATKQLNFSAGPYLSFALGGTRLYNQDVTNTYHKNDFGFSIGAEHDLYKNFALGVNYFVGLKNIWLNDQGGTFKYTNRALQFTLIYKFKKQI